MLHEFLPPVGLLIKLFNDTRFLSKWNTSPEATVNPKLFGENKPWVDGGNALCERFMIILVFNKTVVLMSENAFTIEEVKFNDKWVFIVV